MKTICSILLLISLLVLFAIPANAGLAQMAWNVGTERFGQALAQNPETSKVMEAYQATQNPSGYLQNLVQSSVCDQEENRQACSAFSTIQGISGGGAQSVVSIFCLTNEQSELCTGYQKGMQAFGQVQNVQGMFQNPGQAAQTYALGEMTKSVNPQLGSAIQTITTVQGHLNSLQMASSGNSDQLLQTALNYGVSSASGERTNPITGMVVEDTESTISTEQLRTRRCVVSFNLDGSIQDINGCRTTKETDISLFLNTSKQVVVGPDCNIFKRGNELSIIANEGNTQSRCYITIRNNINREDSVRYDYYIPRNLEIENNEFRSGYFLFREGQLTKAIMLSSKNDNEIKLGERRALIGKGVLAVYENNEIQLNYDYVSEYRGNSVTRLQSRNNNRWTDLGSLNPGINTRIRQLENGVEISGEGFEVTQSNRNARVKSGSLAVLSDGNLRLGTNTEASIFGRDSGAYLRTRTNEVSLTECAETYPRAGNIVDSCLSNEQTFFARGSNFNAGLVKQLRLERATTIADIAFQNSLSSETVCSFNIIQQCSRDTQLSRNQVIVLPVSIYELRNNGRVTRTEAMQGDRRLITERVNGNVVRGYNGFGLENLDRVILRTNLPIVSPNIVSVTNYEDTRIIASNTNEGTCLSRNGECGVGSVDIIRR